MRGQSLSDTALNTAAPLAMASVWFKLLEAYILNTYCTKFLTEGILDAPPNN
jgi:hypothetical protein